MGEQKTLLGYTTLQLPTKIQFLWKFWEEHMDTNQCHFAQKSTEP